MDDEGTRSSFEGTPTTATESSLSPMNHSQIARSIDGQPLSAEHKTVVLKDFVVECAPGDSTHPSLSALSLNTLGHSKEEWDTGYMEKVSPAVWRCPSHRTIKLRIDMDELGLVVHSETAGDIGFVTLRKCDLFAPFMEGDSDRKLQRNFLMEEESPLLRITFTISSHDFTTDFASSVDIKPQLEPILDTKQNTALASASFERIQSTDNEDDINKAILGFEQVTTPDDANDGMYVRDPGQALFCPLESSGRLPDINQGAMDVMVTRTHEDNPDLTAQRSNLGDSINKCSERTEEPIGIESTILSPQEAVQLTPEAHADILSFLNNLAYSFWCRFDCTGDLTDLDNAISTLLEVIQLAPEEHTHMPSWLSKLGYSFLCRFERTGELVDVENAISNLQKAIQCTPEHEAHAANMSVFLANLGQSFRRRFAHMGELTDIKNAISSLQKAVELTPEAHADMPHLLMNLGNSFLDCFKCTGELTDIDSAISILQRVIKLTPEGHTDMPYCLNILGESHCHRFQHTQDLPDIESAISSLQKAIQITQEADAVMPSLLSHLGDSFRCRFEHTGELMDIEVAILNLQKAIKLTPEGHADMSARLSNTGTSFFRRFERTGELADIESAISNLQKSVQLIPETHTDMPVRLSNLGNSFCRRFERTGELTDIKSAILTLQKAVRLTPDAHADFPSRLMNLGSIFRCCFDHTGELTDIDSAILTLQNAVQLTPEEHVNMPTRLNNLGNAFFSRFEKTRELMDIENAILNLQKVVRLTPEAHTNMPFRLNNLGNSFLSRFEHAGKLEDLENAISTLQKVVQLIPEAHAHMASHLNNLANSLFTRFKATENLEDILQAISVLRLSATQSTGKPSIRLIAARTWALFASILGNSQLTFDAFSVAIGLLPQVAGLEQTINKRHQTLLDISDITASATAAAINDNKLETALAWLEQGRCLVWNQINHLRTPADNLRAYDPSLADRFLHVAHKLEVSGSRREQHTTFMEGAITQIISLQEESLNHVYLAKEWNELLKEIRTLPQFQDFLQPPQISNLLSRLPLDGPIVVFNIHQDRCDALALISGLDSPIHIPLKTFSLQQAIQLCKNIYQLKGDRGTRPFNLRNPEGSMYNVLHELWVHVVKPILGVLGYLPCPESNQSRIWWCPSGPLTFLPIHAAGIYGKEKAPKTGSCVSDYVVSSYTPTITALLDKIEMAPTTNKNPTRVLLISQPLTPGHTAIPGTREETQAIKDIMGAETHAPRDLMGGIIIKSLLLEDAFATVTQVKEIMKTHSWVHFACHAIQDTTEPLKSGVQLHDGRLELLDMMKQQLPNSDLAFLSACQTSTGNEKLPDEVVHLAAGMLAAGYRSVTMWSIKDKYGPVVAKDFYAHILAENLGKRCLNSADAARALHYAIQKIRKELGDSEDALLTWVPYVHFGI